MRKQTKNVTVKPTSFSKEDLLGFSTKAFQLEQSEYVAKKIIDQLLFLTFDKVRKINVKNLEGDYSAYRTFRSIKRIVSLGLIRPETEYEKQINYNIDFEIKPSKIDTWASNKAKILTSVPQEEVPVCPKKPSWMTTKENKNEKSSMISPRGKKGNAYKDLIGKLKKNYTPARELPMDAKPIIFEQVEQLDELEQMKLKGYRIYFQEKEIERQKRKILEKEQEERAKEEEKKIKQVLQMMNSSSLISWDMDGRFLPLKPLNVNQMRNFPEARLNVDERKYIFDPEKLYDLDKDGISKRKINTDVYREEPPKEELQPKYYQPDPLVSFKLEKGTVLEFYGKKKDGGDFGDSQFDIPTEEDQNN